MHEILLSARCFPTEDRAKIVTAIKSMFPDASIEGDDPIRATAHSTDTFAELLRKQRIRDAARQVMRRHMQGRTTIFLVNKQVAVVGKISFSEEEHPLGDIEVTISSDELESLIDSVAPSTRSEVAR